MTAFKDQENHHHSALASMSNSKDEKVNLYVMVNGFVANCLLDTGAKYNHVDKNFCQRAKIDVNDNNHMKVDLAVKGATTKTQGVCTASVDLRDREYSAIDFSVMDGLLVSSTSLTQKQQ